MATSTRQRRWRAGLAAALVGALLAAAPAAAGNGTNGSHDSPTLDGPRGVDVDRWGTVVVAQASGEYGVLRRTHHDGTEFVGIGQVPQGYIAPALDTDRHGNVYVLTAGGAPGTGAGTLYRWSKRSGQQVVADVSAYQQQDPDPYDLEDNPTDTNPFGVAALGHGAALVADAAGNDLLKVRRDGSIYTVARVKPRMVEVPEGIPAIPDGPPVPPAGTVIPSEAVITSVTVGNDGFWYIGELRGFPATPGTSQIWRVHPRAHGAVCDPEHPRRGRCKLYADGFTSIVALDSDRRGNLYVVELSKKSWLAFEFAEGDPDATIGSLYQLRRNGSRHELAAGELQLPGDAAVGRDGKVYVTTPVFGPGSVKRVR